MNAPMNAESAQNRMVEEQLRRRDIHDAAVLDAMRRVPRHKFVPVSLESDAYLDMPLPIDEGQTISQPYIVALTAQALGLKPTDCVLEIGTGSGYAAAVLAELTKEVVTVERNPLLASQAEARLRALGYTNVTVIVGDGTLGFPDRAPYNGIAVTASGPRVPPSLAGQLAPGGRMVIPVGENAWAQELLLITRVVNAAGETEWREQNLGPVRFVPLIGKEGW